MTTRANPGSEWSGGRPQLNLARSLGSFTRFSQVKNALLQGGVAAGLTATLVGKDSLEIATFERRINPSLEPEVRLYCQHIRLDRILEDSFEVGAGLDIDLTPIGGGSLTVESEVGLKLIGGGHVLLRFAGYFRGPSFYISADVLAGLDSPGNGAYIGAGYHYDSGSVAICGGVGKTPAGWYRVALIGDSALPLSSIGALFIQRKVADIAAVASPEGWRQYVSVFRGYDSDGAIACGGWRNDDSDTLATDNFVNSGADYGLSSEDRQLILAAYPAGGDSETTWRQLHVNDADESLS